MLEKTSGTLLKSAQPHVSIQKKADDSESEQAQNWDISADNFSSCSHLSGGEILSFPRL